NFTGLAPGSYSVAFVAPAGYVFTTANRGDDATDSDADATTGITGSYTLVSGQTDNTVDAGLYRPAAIGDRVWEDSNGNGQQDAGELGIAGAIVKLRDSNGNVIATTTTDSNGFYNFTGLAPGSYSVAFVAPTGYVFTTANIGNDATDSDADAITGITGSYTLVSGQTDNTVDAGLYRPAAIGDRVWEDSNGNGQQDAGELGIAGVTVKLRNSSGSVIATTTTNA
ncbi:SdrD B-like domain-containing protein, partial [Singulisphaera acidiphila]